MTDLQDKELVTKLRHAAQMFKDDHKDLCEYGQDTSEGFDAICDIERNMRQIGSLVGQMRKAVSAEGAKKHPEFEMVLSAIVDIPTESPHLIATRILDF